MRNVILFIAAASVFTGSLAFADGGVQTICTPNPTICTSLRITPDDRYDPFVQHLLVRQQLNALPLNAQITNFYLPYTIDKRGLEEIQIRFLDELRRREDRDEGTTEE